MMKKTDELSDRAIKYLQSIAKIQSEKEGVRQIDVSRDLGVKPSSCFSAILGLIRKGYVIEKDNKYLLLSENAQQLVNLFHRNDSILCRFFAEVLGVPEKAAKQDIENIEHHISIDTSIRLCKFLHFLEEGDTGFIDFKKRFNSYKVDRDSVEVCHDCPQREACNVYQEQTQP